MKSINGKRCIHVAWIFILPALFVLFCRKEPTLPGAGQTADQRSRTLASLKRIDPYPLYSMVFYGDYGFDGMLESGIASGGQCPGKEGWACSCFAALGSDSDPVFGRNFDWYGRSTLVLFTDPPGGFASVSLVDMQYLGYGPDPDLESIESREALLDAPFWSFDGMNERGVAIAIMAVDQASAPHDARRKTIADIHLVRLILDHAGDTEEAVSLAGQFNIRTGDPALHYLVSDPRKAAVIEFVAGEMKVLWNSAPWQVSTNFILSGDPALQDPSGSDCWRYRKLAEELDDADGRITMTEGMNLLSAVSQEITQWSAVYGLKTGLIRIAMGRNFDAGCEFILQAGGGP
ncbi:linear amide C-N hydrolase [bacterium]|nr:linear amide C-N hydrolase [bacterium]